MRYVVLVMACFALSCSEDDPGDSAGCNKATQELTDATEALRILRLSKPPSICNPCTVQQEYAKEEARLVKIEADKKAAKNSACN
jgi:hypothetical protein